MGKKNKKSRRYDDDDLLLGDEIATDNNTLEANEDTTLEEDSSALPLDETQDADETLDDTEKHSQAKEQLNNNKIPKQSSTSIINIDLIKLEATMTEVLKSYENNYQSEDWLYRTIEKNMHLPKHSLKSNLESDILDDILARVENEVQTKLDIRYDEDMKNKSKFDVLLAEISLKTELSSADEATLREQAILVRLDPDEVIATVREAINSASNTDEVDEQQLDSVDNYSMSVSILLALRPYIHQSSTHQSSFYLIVRYICLVLYKVMSLILGEQASTKADQLWEKIHLPQLKAAQLAQEIENDNKMLQNNNHLWSNEQQTWIEKDKVYHPAAHTSTIPPTIRYNTSRKVWERWQKNLTTRTKAMKQAAAIGKVAPPFTRGTFVPVRVGEGWASAPDQAEVDNEQIVSGGVRFFVCLPMKQQQKQQQQQSIVSEKQQLLEVVDVTTWVSKTLLSKEVAREVGAVDSGKVLFSLDVSSLLIGKKGRKKGNKNSNNRGKKNQSKDENNKDDEEDETTVARKGVGYTARVNDKYMDRMNNK